MSKKRVSIVGCGYVADYYMLTLAPSPTLEVAGARLTTRFQPVAPMPWAK